MQAVSPFQNLKKKEKRPLVKKMRNIWKRKKNKENVLTKNGQLLVKKMKNIWKKRKNKEKVL